MPTLERYNKLTKSLKDIKNARREYPTTPEKYLKQCDRDAVRLQKDMMKLEAMYLAIHKLEDKILEKYDIDY